MHIQPPKRKQAAAASKRPTKRRSKLAREHDITADQEAEILDAFALFADESRDNEVAIADVRRCLNALDVPPANNNELQELLETVDPDGTGWVGYEHFVAIAALKLNTRHEDPEAQSEEVAKAYRLFTKGVERDININDLRRVAREMKEDVPDDVLKDMIREATGGALGGVGKDDFEGVMRRAGVFG